MPCPARTQQANLKLDLHIIYPLMLNAKQGSCEYQIYVFFGSTRRGNTALSSARQTLLPSTSKKQCRHMPYQKFGIVIQKTSGGHSMKHVVSFGLLKR